MKRFAARLALSAVFAFAAELAVASYTMSLVRGAVLPAAGLSFVLPFIGAVGSAWFCDEKSTRRRLWLVAAGAVGYAAGTLAVMSLWPA